MTGILALILMAGDGSGSPVDLSGWVSLALANSPAVAGAEAALSAAQAELKASGAFLWPTLSFSASSGYAWVSNQPDGAGHTGSESYTASLALSQELLGAGGRNWLLLRAQRKGFQAAEADHRAARLELVMSVVEAYYAVVEAEGLLAASNQSLERSVGQLERADALYGMGGLTTLELLQVQVQESRARLDATRSRQNLNNAYNNLLQAAGLTFSHDAPWVDTAAVLTPVPPDFMDALEQDLSGNPTLTAARLRTEQAFISAEASGRNAWPSLSANASWGWSDDGFDGFGGIPEKDTWSVGVRLNWTIFDGFARETAMRSARAGALRGRASLEELEASLESGLAAARGNVAAAYESWMLSGLALEQAAEQYRLSRLTYDMGGLPLVDLLDAQETLAEAQAGLASARVDALLEEARFYALLGFTPRLGE